MAKIKLDIDTDSTPDHFDRIENMRLGPKPKVLFISSIKLTTTLLTQFSNGLSGEADQLTPIDALNYAGGSTTAIETAIQNNHGPAQLLVTAGGLVSHLAAKKKGSIHMKGY